jgi:hypothetical protein
VDQVLCVSLASNQWSVSVSVEEEDRSQEAEYRIQKSEYRMIPSRNSE